METRIENDYASFYHSINRVYCGNCEDADSTQKARDKTIDAKLCYLELKTSGFKGIKTIRECLNTTEKRLGMEVTQ